MLLLGLCILVFIGIYSYERKFYKVNKVLIKYGYRRYFNIYIILIAFLLLLLVWYAFSTISIWKVLIIVV